MLAKLVIKEVPGMYVWPDITNKKGLNKYSFIYRWLLCYPSGGTNGSDSPSPQSESANSNASTPSPTDHGFKMPNSYSNERPTSLPVALLNATSRTLDESKCCVDV